MANAVEKLLSITRSGLEQIGYQRELLLSQYRFADYLDPSYPVREIALAGFAQQPPSYRTAGFGVLVATGGQERMTDFAALGAPQALVLDPVASEVRLWKLLKTDGPELVEKIEPRALLSTIKSREAEWGPEGVLRAKAAGKYSQPEQLDIYDFGLLPVLEREVHNKLDQLFGNTIAVAIRALVERRRHEPSDADYRGLFRLMFRLVAAKLLADRQYPGEWSNRDVGEVLEAVEGFYFQTSTPEPILEDRVVQQLAWDQVRTGFHLQNLSLEALAHVYENTFVSMDTRKKYGTHATPPEIAEFIVGNLPFQDIQDPHERTVFEPFAGHAPFLIAALGRLRSLLPMGFGVEDRHKYLVNALSGIELDSFAREVARYSLILADYPNPNGWRIAEADAFSSPRFDELLLRSNVVLCNPPFGQFTSTERAQYSNLRSANKAVEALLRVLEKPPLMLGFVLPRLFTKGQMYRAAREQLARSYDNISITALPDIAFRFSEAETVVVLADVKRRQTPQWHRAFVSKQDYEQFRRTGVPTWEDVEQAPELVGPEPELWKDPLAKNLRERLSSLSTLRQVSNIHRGIEYGGTASEHVSRNPKPGFVPGLLSVEDGLGSYVIESYRYLDANPAVMRTEAYRLPWNRPKVIVNAVRVSRGPWRMMAAVDEEGLVCYQLLHGVWPKDDFPIEVLAAVLNGPVANTLLSASETTRHNLVRDLQAIPLPDLSWEERESVRELVRKYRTIAGHRVDTNDADRIDLMTQIDTIVLSGYGLPDWLESKLMEYIGSVKRPRLETSLVEQLNERHARLIDKKFVEGLRDGDVQELSRIDRLLDAAEASYYAPMTEALTMARDTLLENRRSDEQ